MLVTLDSLYAAALDLTDESRLQLVERLIPTIQSDPSLHAEQLSEVQRRIAEVDAGHVKMIPGEQVFREVEQSLAQRRKS